MVSPGSTGSARSTSWPNSDGRNLCNSKIKVSTKFVMMVHKKLTGYIKVSWFTENAQMHARHKRKRSVSADNKNISPLKNYRILVFITIHNTNRDAHRMAPGGNHTRLESRAISKWHCWFQLRICFQLRNCFIGSIFDFNKFCSVTGFD